MLKVTMQMCLVMTIFHYSQVRLNAMIYKLTFESDVEDHEGENLHVSDKTRKCLFELFWEDAVAKKTEKKVWY